MVLPEIWRNMTTHFVKVSSSSKGHQVAQLQGRVRPVDLQMMQIASQVSQIIEDHIKIKASDGSEIHVCQPRYAGLKVIGHSSLVIQYDDRDRVIVGDMDESVLAEGIFDGKSWRITAGFDYSAHGMQKIGKIWVDANNRRAVSRAQAFIATGCVIL